jgi:primosomal protein N'
MIAQVVFDLPLDGPFDYLIPEQLVSQMTVGRRVKVSFGPRPQIGFVIGLLEESSIAKLKPVLSLVDNLAAFNSLDLTFAKTFSAYYGCSLGETLATILRNKENHQPSVHREHQPLFSLYRCHPNGYADKIKEITTRYPASARFLILVPDIFRAEAISQQLKGNAIKIGARSSVFESDGQYDCVIMVDEEDSSYKQEQTPMYETRQVLLTRSNMYGFDIAFISISPSVELMAFVREHHVQLIEGPHQGLPSPRLIDLTNYKFVPGLIAPPVRDALDAALKGAKKSILVLNRRGSYRVTRCVDCAEVLKCSHCDSPMIYSRLEGKFLCRHCTYTAPGSTVCPKCHKPSWKSMGIGVEQLQTELKKYFPLARIQSFERAGRDVKRPNNIGSVKSSSNVVTGIKSLPEFDILIATNAVLRFQGTLKVQVAAFIDFDAEINRLDMRSAFNAFSLALHISSMAIESVFIQTRNSNHYVLQHLSRGDCQGFYDEELKLRKEFGFSPFKHWVKISWRGKVEKSTREAASQVYNVLSKSVGENDTVTPPLADAVGRKRDQFRFNVMVQTNVVAPAVALIKASIAQIKRPSRVIVTMNVDP